MKVKDMTMEDAKAICLKARTNKNGKVKDSCAKGKCPLYVTSDEIAILFPQQIRLCDLIRMLNEEVKDV